MIGFIILRGFLLFREGGGIKGKNVRVVDKS
jgi:hypothetical protein